MLLASFTCSWLPHPCPFSHQPAFCRFVVCGGREAIPPPAAQQRAGHALAARSPALVLHSRPCRSSFQRRDHTTGSTDRLGEGPDPRAHSIKGARPQLHCTALHPSAPGRHQAAMAPSKVAKVARPLEGSPPAPRLPPARAAAAGRQPAPGLPPEWAESLQSLIFIFNFLLF